MITHFLVQKPSFAGLTYFKLVFCLYQKQLKYSANICKLKWSIKAIQLITKNKLTQDGSCYYNKEIRQMDDLNIITPREPTHLFCCALSFS